jgi:hypothetical protein
LRRETGSFTARATAPDAGTSGLSRSVCSGMSLASSLGVFFYLPLRKPRRDQITIGEIRIPADDFHDSDLDRDTPRGRRQGTTPSS